MRMEFIDSDNLRKLYIVKNLFSGMPQHMLAYPRIFGTEFEAGYALYREFERPCVGISSRKGSEMEVLRALFSGKDVENRLARMGKPDFMKALDSFHTIPEVNDDLFNTTKAKLVKCLDEHEEIIGNSMHRVFGFELPEVLNVLLCEGFGEEWVKGQMLIMNDPVLLGLSCRSKQDINDTFAIAMHELVHSLVYYNKVLNYGLGGTGAFEEALIRLFLPHGAFGASLGLSNSILETGEKEAKLVYPDASELARLVKDYMENDPKETVWNFLSKTKFNNFINQRTAGTNA